MLTSRYMQSTKNIPAIFGKMQEGIPPPVFNTEHLSNIGFTSSNDRGIVPLLKELGFLNGDGSPTQRYRDYRDKTRSKSVLGAAVKSIYEDLFHINENVGEKDREAIIGRFKSAHSSSDVVAEAQARTFLALAKLSDFAIATESKTSAEAQTEPVPESLFKAVNKNQAVSLNYRIEIHLPASRDVEVFNAIFKSLRQNLIDV